jgi:hypothetical protein
MNRSFNKEHIVNILNRLKSTKIKMTRVTNGFAKLNLLQFRQALTVIAQSMNGNPHFTSLQPKIDILNAEAVNYDVLALKALSRDKAAVLARDSARKKITGMLHNIGYSVMAIASGDTEILDSSGFPYSQPPKPTPPMSKPANPKVASGVNSGQINCKTVSQPGLKSVNYYITSDPAVAAGETMSAWNVFSYNKVKFTFTNLIPGQRYYIRIGLVGVRGQEVLSEVISYIAQ